MPSRQLSFLYSFPLLLVFSILLTYLSINLHYTLPTPETALFAQDGTTPIFSEAQAMKYIRDLSTHEDGGPKYRIVGTEEMVETEKYIMTAIEAIKAEVVAKMGLKANQIEVWHQSGSGSHLFDFMEKKVHKKYYSITNVIVRLSDGTEASKANAILANAHTDSTLPSPGAADDLVGVAIMLEALRVMALYERKLTNSVVFLFNGAEESLQDASHLFITQHPLKDSVRGIINLEACGEAGPALAFQATNDEMIKAFAKTPRPYGTVLATEVFATGIIVSDTDFRQFEQYGGLSGLDMALVQDSYKYHTRLDVASAIEPGALQHFGENILALLEYFTSNSTTMGNSPLPTPKLPKSKPSSTIFFSGLGGKLFVMYSRAQATIIYSVMSSVSAIVVIDRIDWGRKGVYLAGTLGVAGSLLAAILGANAAAFASAIVMGKTLMWFRHEALPVLIYGPPAAVGAILFQRTLSNFMRTPFATPLLDDHESSLLEHATLVGQVIYYSIVLLAGHSAGIGSSYLFALSLGTALLALVVNDYVLKRGKREVHLAAYFIGQVSPLLLGVEGLLGFLDLFVPLTGRMGADAPADFIIASLVAGVGYLAVPMVLPFCHRYGSLVTSRLALALTFITAGTLGWFTRPSWNVYDAEHPKRLLVLHMENITTSPPTHQLHVASVDRGAIHDLILDATRPLLPPGVVPVKTPPEPDWDIIFPVSTFLTTFSIPLPESPATYDSPWSRTFTLTARKSILNSVKKTRSLDIVMSHPEIMWPVIAFDADVVSWDLPEKAARGFHRHHVKSVAAWGVDEFTLSLVIALSDKEFDAAVRESQRAKGQRGDVSPTDARLAGLRVDFSGLDRHGMFPASSRHILGKADKRGMSFFAELDERLPQEIDAMLLNGSMELPIVSSNPSQLSRTILLRRSAFKSIMSSDEAYDPPLPRSRSHSRIARGIEEVEAGAFEVAQVAHEVRRAARVVGKVEQTFEDEYGEPLRGRSLAASRRHSSVSYPSDTSSNEGEVRLPRQARTTVGSATFTSRSSSTPTLDPASRITSLPSRNTATPTRSVGDRKLPSQPTSNRKQLTGAGFKKSSFLGAIDGFLNIEDAKAVIAEAQEMVEDISDQTEEIRYRREELSGSHYKSSTSGNGRAGRQHPIAGAAVKLDDHELKYLATLILTTGRQIEHTHKTVRAINHQYKTITEGGGENSAGFDSGDLQLLAGFIKTLNTGYANAIQDIEELAQEENSEVEDGTCTTRFLLAIKSDNPAWDKTRVLKALDDAKNVSKNQISVAKLNLTSYAGDWALNNPFSEINRIISNIEKYEHGISSSDPWPPKKDTKRKRKSSRVPESAKVVSAPGLFKRLFGRPNETPAFRKPEGRSKKRPKQEGFFELGKGGESDSGDEYNTSNKYGNGTRSIPTPSPGDAPPPSSSEKPGWSYDADGNMVAPDGTVLPYHVPTDGTDSETPSELLQDAKDKIKHEHIYIPLVILFWICIFAVVIYWGVSRLLGSENPLGDVDLGSHLGNDAWNDTTDALTQTSSVLSISTQNLTRAGISASNVFELTQAAEISSQAIVSASRSAAATSTAATTDMMQTVSAVIPPTSFRLI